MRGPVTRLPHFTNARTGRRNYSQLRSPLAVAVLEVWQLVPSHLHVLTVLAVGPLLSAAAVQLSIEWVGPDIDTSIQVFSRQYNGILLGCVAVSSLLSNTLAVKFGKRPILLLSSILLVIGQFGVEQHIRWVAERFSSPYWTWSVSLIRCSRACS